MLSRPAALARGLSASPPTSRPPPLVRRTAPARRSPGGATPELADDPGRRQAASAVRCKIPRKTSRAASPVHQRRKEFCDSCGARERTCSRRGGAAAARPHLFAQQEPHRRARFQRVGSPAGGARRREDAGLVQRSCPPRGCDPALSDSASDDGSPSTVQLHPAHSSETSTRADRAARIHCFVVRERARWSSRRARPFIRKPWKDTERKQNNWVPRIG